eukprot:scaffold3955_cov26-Tisochrysis_lutea.AAC.4
MPRAAAETPRVSCCCRRPSRRHSTFPCCPTGGRTRGRRACGLSRPRTDLRVALRIFLGRRRARGTALGCRAV